jgi:hypothetical protein
VLIAQRYNLKNGWHRSTMGRYHTRCRISRNDQEEAAQLTSRASSMVGSSTHAQFLPNDPVASAVFGNAVNNVVPLPAASAAAGYGQAQE